MHNLQKNDYSIYITSVKDVVAILKHQLLNAGIYLPAFLFFANDAIQCRFHFQHNQLIQQMHHFIPATIDSCTYVNEI